MSGGSRCWAILTGEYPPEGFGVSDYTRLLACGLAKAQREVHVFAPASSGVAPMDEGVNVHCLSGLFDLFSLPDLSRELDCLGECTLLVQYVPHAFGWRAMNLPLCLWLYSRRNRNRIITMFHEVALPFGWRQPLRHNLIALVNRVMAALVGAASERVLVSIPAWGRMLEELGVEREKIQVSPIFSNLPTMVDTGKIFSIRSRYRLEGRKLVGHFGTFAYGITQMLDQIIPALLGDESVGLLLVGRGNQEYAGQLRRRFPAFEQRIFSIVSDGPDDIAGHLSACDLLLQIYPDGLSGRRGTLMAGLALGVPVVSNLGALSENWWADSGAVALAASPEPEEIIATAQQVLGNELLQRQLSCNGRRFYFERFDVQQTVAKILQVQSRTKG